MLSINIKYLKNQPVMKGFIFGLIFGTALGIHCR